MEQRGNQHKPPPAPHGLFRPLASAARWVWRHVLAIVTLGVLGVFVAFVLGLVVADLAYLVDLAGKHAGADGSWAARLAAGGRWLFDLFAGLFRSPETRAAMLLSAYTSTVTLGLVILFAVPIGYALSRYRFPGHALADTVVEMPLVVPPLVIGLSLLVLFSTAPGRWIESGMDEAGLSRYAATGIVLCQFLLSVPFAIRAAKAAFDDVDVRLEDLARTLGCTRLKAFWSVALPLARSGLIAGCIMAWARAVGLFGPLIVFVGCVRMKSEVLPSTIYLEVSTGGIEVALAAAIVMLVLAGGALAAIHYLVGGRRGWRYD